ncbi:MAG: hypothetical protein Q7L07_00335 [Pseudohongiella sp.]|nr:hypothetical protein [Pseudohongiella sp.]
MKIEFKKSTLIKLGLILVLIVVAPFIVPFTLEFIIVADLMGLEALIVFLLAYGKSIIGSIYMRLSEMRSNVGQTVLLIAELYMFKPKIYLGHATVSSLVLVFASSIMLACIVWLPVMYMSAGYIT